MHPALQDRFQGRAPRLLVVGGGLFQVDLVRAAKRLGAEVWATDRNPNAPALALVDHPLAIDFGDPEKVLALGAHKFDGVTTAASDAALPTVVACADAWGLAAVSPASLRLCQDKHLTSDALRGAGLHVPVTRLVERGDSPMPHLDAVGGFPFVIKPRFGAGGRGVSIVRREADIARAVEKALSHTKPDTGFLVQEYLRGLSVGVEAFLWGGKLARGFCLGDQYRDDFVSPIGHSLPPELPAEIERTILAQIERIAVQLGIVSGPVNFDLRFEGGMVRLIEANARLGGNSITPLIRAAYGVDLSEATVLSALGVDPSAVLKSTREPVGTATRLFLVRGTGTLRRASTLPEFKDPRILEFELLEEGSALAARVDDFAIVGRCLVRGTSEADAVAFAADIARTVEAHISPSEPR